MQQLYTIDCVKVKLQKKKNRKDWNHKCGAVELKESCVQRGAALPLKSSFFFFL